MIIDLHVIAGFFNEISQDPKRVNFRRENFYLYKQHVWPIDILPIQMDCCNIDKSVLLAEDLTTTAGDTIVSNEEIKRLVDCHPNRLIGFGSVDPRRHDAVAVIEKAFCELELMGLHLSPANQKFMPNDFELMKPIYETCIKYNKPILFDSGMIWMKNAPTKYSQPILFEDVALGYPELRICLGHFGWPWIMETTMLLLKYPNVYADTAMLYFDSPKQFFRKTFNEQLGEYWIDRMLMDKVMFGSNYPRIEQKRMLSAIDVLNLRTENKAKVVGENAMKFIGIEE